MPFKNITKDEFVRRSIAKHGDRFDYSLASYTDSRIPVVIICPVHGEFLQKPRIHMQGFGCKKCQIDQQVATNTKSNEKFLEEVRKTHGTSLDFSKTVYINCRCKVIATCFEHGDFEIHAKHLRDGHGCQSCGRGRSTKNFLSDAQAVHGDRYDYSISKYEGYDISISIICRQHGAFKQPPYSHLLGHNCPKCSKRISDMEMEWLDSLLIEVERQFRTSAGIVDGFDHSSNTAYEFNGDYWHGNPDVYRPEDKSYFGITFGELYRRTLEKEQKLKNLGFNVVSMWERDFRIQTGRRVPKLCGSSRTRPVEPSQTVPPDINTIIPNDERTMTDEKPVKPDAEIGSDLARVDAYVLTDADYAEIPELTEADFARATVSKGGLPIPQERA